MNCFTEEQLADAALGHDAIALQRFEGLIESEINRDGRI